MDESQINFSTEFFISNVTYDLITIAVMDMARHVPLYKALLLLLRSIASCPELVPLLLPASAMEDSRSSDTQSIHSLLHKLKNYVSSYTARLAYANFYIYFKDVILKSTNRIKLYVLMIICRFGLLTICTCSVYLVIF